MSNDDTKVCPYCAETIKAAAIVCRYCGRAVAKNVEPIAAKRATESGKPLSGSGYMQRYQLEMLAGALAWKAFPRSAGILITVSTTAIMGDPITGISYGFFTWFILGSVRFIMRDPYRRNMWSCLSSPVFLISNFAFKWGIGLLCLAILLWLWNYPTSTALMFFGGLFVFDLLINIVTGGS